MALAVVAIPMFLVVKYFEERGTFDSVGTWYTLYVTAAFSLLPALIIAAAVHLVAKAKGATDG